MKKALQYMPTSGYPDLVSKLKEFQKKIHNPVPEVWQNSDLVVTTGSQEGLSKAFEMIFNIGDSIIVEDFVYTGVLAALGPYKLNYVLIEGDGRGMRSDLLRRKLQSLRKSEIPKAMYINPTGANPTGTILSSDRRKEILEICSEFNVLILEDDPYYFLQFDDQTEDRVSSLFSLDREGRVIRFDSFSKILSSGLRVGFATGPKPLIERMMLHMQVSTMHTSGLSQVLLDNLLEEWGTEGLLKHIAFIEQFYRKRRDALNAAAENHLKGLCTWHVPGNETRLKYCFIVTFDTILLTAGGMFLWLKTDGIADTWDLIMEKAMKRNIMLVPGRAFTPFPNEPCPYLRAAFSAIDVDKMDQACQKLAELIKEETL